MRIGFFYFPIAKVNSAFATTFPSTVAVASPTPIGPFVLMIFVSEEVYKYGEFWKINYIPLKFKDLIVHADGTVDIEYDDGYTDIFTTDMDAYIEDLKEKYYITEIVIE